MKLKFRNIFLFALFYLLPVVVIAQQDLSDKLLPVDTKVRIGKLDNGFTYYIRVNHKPEKRVEMRLAINAGSILENDDQQGLAHFVEHMCFNGTANFEKNELKNYLEKIGIRFGPELNAYTSFDETVYMLTIPSDSTDLLEKGFLVMEDWAHAVTFSDNEIDKERGVIIEEWRMGQGYRQRMRDKYFPVLFEDSRYAERLPIGKKDIISGCNYDTLRSFYRDWYRPELMALIVVGDIDPDYAEKKIKEHFSKLQSPLNARKRKLYDVPDQKGTAVSIVSDAEAPMSVVNIIYKTDAQTEKTYDDYLKSLQYSFLTGMLNMRLVELSEKENPPFVGANFYFGSIGARTKDGLQAYALVGEKGVEKGLETLLTEAERVNRFGFTPGEFERFKLDLLNNYENAYNERDKTESRQWAGEYTRNFLESEPIPGIEFEYEFVKTYVDYINLEDINYLARKLVSVNNRVIVIGVPDKPTIITPREEEILNIASSIAIKDIAPYEDKIVGTALLSSLPVPGKIIKQSSLDLIGAVDFKLSNGARVILKPTDFKNDEVVLSAFSLGGHSVYGDNDAFTAMNADGVIQESGVAEFSNSDLNRVLAGKSIYVAPVISYETDQISAEAKTSDIESMFQLIYLYFTDPRADQASFNSYISKKKDLFENLSKEPQNYFYDQYYRFKAQNHKRGDYLPTASDWEKIDFNRSIEIYKERFADAQNFTFIMVGAFNVDSVLPLVEQYIASLPAMVKDENFVDLGIRPPKEKEIHNVYKGNDPKSLAIIYFEKETLWNEKDAFLVNTLGEILGFNYIDILREEMSGVYTVRAKATLQKIPYSNANLQIVIPCAPENVDSLIHAAIGVLAEIQKNGTDPEDIIKAKETKKRQIETSIKTNKFWLNRIQTTLLYNSGFENLTQEKLIDYITAEEIQRVANEYFDVNNYLQVVLYPEELKK